MSHSIALVNIQDGSVQGHKAGCADLSRGALRKHQDSVWTFDVETKHEAWVSYNEDFLAEGPESGQYAINWLPCAKHVPQGLEDTYEAWEADQEPSTRAGLAPVETKPVVTTKVGPKWAYIYVDGAQVAEVRSNLFDAVLAAVTASL